MQDITKHLKRYLEAESLFRETMQPRYLKTLNAERKWLEQYIKRQIEDESDKAQLKLFQ